MNIKGLLSNDNFSVHDVILVRFIHTQDVTSGAKR